MLPGDLSLGISSHHHVHNLTGLVASKSQASCLSNSSEDDTINCRSSAAEDNRTQGSLGAAGAGLGTLAGGGGNSTATVTMPAGIASSFNLAAGAAAVAALGSGVAAGTTSGGGSGGGGGNNTANMSMGLRRFGLKSKAVRITSGDKPSGSANAADAGAVPASGAAQPALDVPLAPSGGAFDDGDDAATRKRRAAAEAAQSPARMVASVVLQDEGMKRRHSPDLAAAAAAGGISGLDRQAPRGAMEPAQQPTQLPARLATGDLGSLRPGSVAAPRQPLVPATPGGSVTAAMPVAAGLSAVPAPVPVAVDRVLATPGPGPTPLGSRPATSRPQDVENMAPGPTPAPAPGLGAMMPMDENCVPGGPGPLGTAAKPAKQPLVPAVSSTPLQPQQDGREPLR